MTFDHRNLDPRAKLAFAGALAVIAVAIPQLVSVAGVAVVLLALVAAGSGFSVRELVASLAPFKLLVPIIVVLNAFFYGGGEVLWQMPVLPLALTVGGIEASALIAGRLVVVASIASWFGGTTEAEEFEVALTEIGVPWGFAFLVSLSVRLVPEMRARYRTIEEAQLSRGLEIGGGPISRARARIPMLIPFFVAVVEYGYELSEALAVRDFGRSVRRTHVVQLRYRRVDYVLSIGAVVVLIGFIGAFIT